MYKSEAIFHLPGAFELPDIYSMVFSILKEHPEFIRDNVRIGSIYGCPRCIWNGGTLATLDWNKQQLDMIKGISEEYNIPIRFTFTNTQLNKNDFYDTYCNTLLSIFSTGKNEIVYSDIHLKDYIECIYGNKYKYIQSSVAECQNTEDELKVFKEDNDGVILSSRFNKDISFISKIKGRLKSEVLLNDTVSSDYNARRDYFNTVSDAQLCYETSLAKSNTIISELKETNLCTELLSNKFITVENIDTDYLSMNINKFIILGRYNDTFINVLSRIAYYLIKEEYQNYFIVEVECALTTE